MKRKIAIIMIRIIYLFILSVTFFLIIFFYANKIKGELFVTVNGEKYLPDFLECKYIGEKTDEKIIYENNSSGLLFKNSGSMHGMYEYSFTIENEEINTNPKIFVFKTDWWEICNIHINVNMYKEDEIWSADISAEINGRTYDKTFHDVENNVIELRLE